MKGESGPAEFGWFLVLVVGCAVLAFLAGWGPPG